ncbi:ABC-3 protein [Arcobacter nitrofigilis DSM 7299]|uniref:ABC-3 protein n=1 Tax=Arcobacter nitrofigilis (strain ATCC 33309 / DSM 7299 / CCUG 15893 / LMG 7604 / NCTC 12251 / CI) TaxID=572480 RepID=D5UZF2_ARCNC|nr:metal ABC transporter permease [Arcobacter nitrofigilis]ADG92189.1 ABC-3 protein [Arcobacter nitrofigilis DSM 7299]
MLEALNYSFIQNAIIAGLLVSIAAGIIGSLIVVNRMVFLAGGMAHTSYGGIGIAIYFGLPIFLGATVFSIGAALLMSYLTLYQRERIDTFIGLIWACGMAIGIILVDLTPGYNVDLMSYLFGTILAVGSDDLIFMAILVAFIIVVVSLFYRDILAVSYDSEYASLRGINVKVFYTLILVLSALTVVIAIKVVGLILVIALLTIPIYIAEKLSNSLYGMMVISALLSSLFTLVGLYLSYTFNLTSGATIIIVSAMSLFMFIIYKKIRVGA